MDERARVLEVESAEARGRADEARRRVRVTQAMSAAIVAVLLLAGVFLWSDFQAREAAAATLERARILASQARESHTIEAGLWKEAVLAAEQAATATATHGDLRQRADQLVDVVRRDQDQARVDRRLLTWLEGPSFRLSFDIRRSQGLFEKQYVAAFRQWGVDLHEADVAEVAARIRSSNIAKDVVRALDRLAQNHGSSKEFRTKLLDIAVAADPSPWRGLVREATGKDRQALLDLADSEEVDAAPADVLLHLATLIGNDDERYVRLHRLAFKKQPKDYRILHELEKCLWQSGATMQECQWLSLLGVTLRPQLAHAWWHLGLVSLAAGDYAMADSAFARMKELGDGEPQFDRTMQLTRVQQLQKLGFYAEAGRIMEHILQKDPGYALGRIELVRIKLRLWDYEAVVRLCRQLLQTPVPANASINYVPYIHGALGLGLRYQGRFKEAELRVDRAHTMSQSSSTWDEGSHKWGPHVRRLRRYASQLDDAGDGPKDPRQRAQMAQTALMRGRSELALRLFKSALAEWPDTGCGCESNGFTACYRMSAVDAAIRVATQDKGAKTVAQRQACLDQALAWLRAELLHYETRARRLRNPAVLRKGLSRMRSSPVFAPVRPGQGLETNVGSDRLKAWLSFWADVNRVYQNAASFAGRSTRKPTKTPPIKKR